VVCKTIYSGSNPHLSSQIDKPFKEKMKMKKYERRFDFKRNDTNTLVINYFYTLMALVNIYIT